MGRTNTLQKPRARVPKPAQPLPPPKKQSFFTGKNLNAVLCVLLAAGTIALYGPALGHRFLMWDDRDYVTGNSHVQDGVTWSTVKWAFTTTRAANWHPLTWLSHALDCQLFALDAWGHHLDSVLLHALNAVILFLLLVWMTRRTGPSLLVAALFAVHPLNVESVAWIAERKNVLSMLFFLVATGAYVWYAKKPDWRRYLLVGLLFGAGLMAKPMVITLPFVLLLLDYWPLERFTLHSSFFATRQNTSREISGEPRTANSDKRFLWLFLEKLPLLALSAASAWMTLKAQHAVVQSLAEYSWGNRIANAVVAYGLYLWKMLWPARLIALYPHPTTFPTWQVALSAVVLAGITVVAIVFRRKAYLLVGWLWFLGTLVPVIGLVQVGEAAMADRYAYLPLIGVFIMVAWGLDDWAESKRISTTWRLVLALGAVMALACVTSSQIGYWESDYGLWAHAVAVSEEDSLAQQGLADALIFPDGAMSAQDLRIFDTEQKRIDAARQHYEATLNILRRTAQPKSTTYLGNMAGVLNNLGNADRLQNRIDEADQYFEEAWHLYGPLVQKNPELYEPNLAMTLANLGSIATIRNRVGEAYDRDEAALEISQRLAKQEPDKYQAGVTIVLKNLAFLGTTANNLGNAAMQSNHLDEARANYEAALKIWRQLAKEDANEYSAEMVNTLMSLGFLERSEKRPDKARAYFEEAAQIDRQLAHQDPQKYLPDLATRLLNLGNFYTEQNHLEAARPNYEAAVQTYRQLAQQSPDKYSADLAGTLSNLALVDQLENRFEESRTNYSEALGIYRKLAQGNPGNYANYVTRLETSLRDLENKTAAR